MYIQQQQARSKTKQVFRKTTVTITATENGSYYHCVFNIKGMKAGHIEEIRRDVFDIMMFVEGFKQIA